MWYLLYCLPILAYLILLFCSSGNPVSFSDSFSLLGFDSLSSSTIYSTVSSIIGPEGVLPMFSSPGMLLFVCYFCNVWLIRLLVEFVVFIPKLAHSWLDRLYGHRGV